MQAAVKGADIIIAENSSDRIMGKINETTAQLSDALINRPHRQRCR